MFIKATRNEERSRRLRTASVGGRFNTPHKVAGHWAQQLMKQHATKTTSLNPTTHFSSLNKAEIPQRYIKS